MYRTEAARAQGWESQVTGRERVEVWPPRGRPGMHLSGAGAGPCLSPSQIQQQEGPDVDPRHLPCPQRSSAVKVLCWGLSKGLPPQELPPLFSPSLLFPDGCCSLKVSGHLSWHHPLMLTQRPSFPSPPGSSSTCLQAKFLVHVPFQSPGPSVIKHLLMSTDTPCTAAKGI